MSEQIAKLNIEEKLIACIELAQKRQADIQALRAENARFRAVITNMQAAWNNKNEVASVYVWNERMKAAMADVDAALQPERGTP